MSHCKIDHIIISAPNLEIGARFVRDTLGVTPQVGGEHARMGTHNLLVRLGDSTYLEIISPNPAAPKPEMPRWFDLDRLQQDSPPKLVAWVARTRDIRTAVAACSEPLGNIESMSRGDLEWLITIPSSGSPPLNGIAPALIEWRTGPHPATKLRDMGCSLVRLEAFHPEPVRVSALLRSVGVEGPVSVLPSPAGGSSFLVAQIGTPGGLRQLSTPAISRSTP